MVPWCFIGPIQYRPKTPNYHTLEHDLLFQSLCLASKARLRKLQTQRVLEFFLGSEAAAAGGWSVFGKPLYRNRKSITGHIEETHYNVNLMSMG